jgi:hypothetical protein
VFEEESRDRRAAQEGQRIDFDIVPLQKVQGKINTFLLLCVGVEKDQDS